ncbi:MAG TPA: hypothetical protein VHY20_05070 [Pirellulales bacterium]|jgi:hypothetical protein|nr:hypothetical protein [Pirellulales bacterium]
MAKFEAYRDWLGITETARPLNYYQLLRVTQFEDDTAKIRANYQRMNSHLRKYAASEYKDKASALLSELTKAMLCLTDSRRKSEYDASLGRKTSGESRKRSLEEILLTRKVLDREQLEKANKLATAIGMDLRDAVMQQKLAKPEVIMQAYAESLGLPFLDLSLMQPNEELLAKLPAVMARQHSCVPLLVDEEKVVVASPNPLRTDVEDEVRLRMGLTVRNVLCTPADIHELINKHYPKEAAAAQLGIAPVAAADAKSKKPAVDPAVRKKRRQQVMMVAGMFTFMAFSLLGSSVLHWDKNMSMLSFYGLGLLVAGIAAGIGYAAT